MVVSHSATTLSPGLSNTWLSTRNTLDGLHGLLALSGARIHRAAPMAVNLVAWSRTA